MWVAYKCLFQAAVAVRGKDARVKALTVNIDFCITVARGKYARD